MGQKNLPTAQISIRPLGLSDRERVRRFIITHWGDRIVVAHGVVYSPEELPGFVVCNDSPGASSEEYLGLITYQLQGDVCELVTLNSLLPGAGIGTMLVDRVIEAAQEQKCRRLWLITTNDNLDALRFYQKRGFSLVAVHRDAVSTSRELKPSIPLTGAYGIPLRDEIEMELILEEADFNSKSSNTGNI